MHPSEAYSFDWQDWNTEKLAAHGIAQYEVEEVFSRHPIWAPNPGHPDRYKMMGYTFGGRALTIIVAVSEDGELVPITGWAADAEELTRYLSQWRENR